MYEEILGVISEKHQVDGGVKALDANVCVLQ